MDRPRALLSVWEKEGIVEFASSLNDMGWTIISTGGTSKKLREANIDVMDVSELTNHPEILSGRVKTLHPAVHGGILARRKIDDDLETLKNLEYGFIDLVCVNLYPFQNVAAQEPKVSNDDLIEMIDIGGPTMIRSAAKNYEDVIVVTNNNQYENIIENISKSAGQPSGIDIEMRKRLAISAYQCTASYDAIVSNELENRFTNSKIPSKLFINTDLGTSLRYGENPHQPAAFYPDSMKQIKSGLAKATQHGGKELSFNNYLDLDGALRIARGLLLDVTDKNKHGCVIIKHTNPCGVALDEFQTNAWVNALASDPESAFGCVIAFTSVVEKETAKLIGDHFFECIISPGYASGALEILSLKKNRRMLTLQDFSPRKDELRIRQIDGGWVSQIQGAPNIDWDDVKCVTTRTANKNEYALAKFGCTVLSEVKSNSVALVSETETGFTTVGIGPGQTSRVEAVHIAARRAGSRAKSSMLISDAFFPFRDGIDAANKIGVKTVIQPGGSIRDQEVIDAANEHQMSMLFTNKRLFLH